VTQIAANSKRLPPAGLFVVQGSSIKKELKVGYFAYSFGPGIRNRQINMGWETGIEPATFGATDRRSTS
jgi:hypothetical protein